MTQQYNVTVVGGGPAGAAAAALLAQGGLRVALVEQKAFPRQKVCGEFVSTGARPVLRQLGILDAFDSLAGPKLRRIVAFPHDGHALEASLPADGNGYFARGMSRDLFDQLILNAAREAGVRVIQPAYMEFVEGDAATGFTVAIRHMESITSETVIVADGKPRTNCTSHAVEPEKQGDHPPAVRPIGYLGFKAHFSDCDLPDDVTVLAGTDGIYAGLLRTSDITGSLSEATLDDGKKRYNLAFAAHQRLVTQWLNAEDLLNYLLAENRGLKRVMRRSIRLSKWYSCGPMVPGIRRLYNNGQFFAGNAAGEVHALVGEGMTLALRSGRLLANHLLAGLGGGKNLAVIGDAYEKAWKKEFTRRLGAGNLFSDLLMRPMLGSIASDALNTFPEVLHAAVEYSGKSAGLVS